MDYEKQAEKFLTDTNTTFKAEFLKNGFHFADDKEPRDIYLITLSRGGREYKFNFGQSIKNSGNTKRVSSDGKDWKGKALRNYDVKNKDFKEPTAYEVLACLTKNEVESFEDFCASFGYDEDSRKAEKTYKAVLEEWKNVKMLFSDSEIDKLQEIQ